MIKRMIKEHPTKNRMPRQAHGSQAMGWIAALGHSRARPTAINTADLVIEPDHNPGSDAPGVMAGTELWGQLAPRAERQPGWLVVSAAPASNRSTPITTFALPGNRGNAPGRW
jgi:hypothetical protein